MIKKFEFKYVDIKNGELLGSFKGPKGTADNYFSELKKLFPDKKIHMKMGAEVKQ